MKMNNEHKPCDTKTENHLYKIGIFAQMNHITIKTLRFYEEQGLVLPAYVDEDNGYRYYFLSQMSDLHRISALKSAGFSIEDIKKLDKTNDTSVFLHKKKADIMMKIAELTRQMAVIDSYLSGDESMLETPVLIQDVPAVTVASMQKRIESYDELFTLMPTMGEEMERLGCECALPEYCFMQYLEPGYKEQQILVEICEAVKMKKEDSELVQFKELPETKAACIYHKGSYNEFPRTYASVLKYIEENGYEICGDIREVYIDGVWNKDREEDWLSEIQIPVQKIGE